MTTTTMIPTSCGRTLAALAMLAPATGLAQQTYGTLADLRASVATDKQVYELGSPPEPITVVIALENGGLTPVIVNQAFDEHLHLELYFVGPDGPVRANRELTTVAPEPPPPNVCLINGEPVPAEAVKAWDAGYQFTVAVPDAHTFYTLPTGVYTVELRAPIATYAAFAPCEPPESFALLDDQYHSNEGEELRSLPQPFTIVGDSDDDGYCYPASAGFCPPPTGPLAAAAVTPGNGVDCDDRNPAVNPGAPESPGNGRDDDCDPATADDVAVTENQPPVANAGPDQRVSLGTPVTLDGRASHDPDRSLSPLTFAWTKSSGPDVTLAGAGTAQPSFTPTALGDHVFNLTVSDGQGGSTDSVTVTVWAYNFTGFFPPVDNPPTFNSMKAGAAVPVKFSLNGDKGLDILSGVPISKQMDCTPSGAVDTVEETVATGTSSLSYDAVADQYKYLWKTDKGWAGKCREFMLKLKDGTTHPARFKFTK